MTINARTWLLRRKWILVAVALPVLIALWWAFRPEKLWINQKVSEAAPFDASGEPQPILTARFKAKTQQTSGRATVYQKPGGGEFLRPSDFTPPDGSNIHVLLARSDDPILAQDVADGRKRQSNSIYAQGSFGAEVESWWHREGSNAGTEAG